MEEKWPCPRCQMQFSGEELLQNCSIAWPNQQWLLFTCPKCSGDSHIEVKNGALAVGEIDGGPGPCFFPLSEQKIPGLKIAVKSNGIGCNLNGKKYFFRARC